MTPAAPRAATIAGNLAGQLERAAWWGRPADALPVLAGLRPGSAPARACWLAGVCLGALGRYREAARWLDPARDPLAAAALASHLRQLGRHAEAEPLDELALAAATDPEARADALVGLVADAVGRRDAAAMTARLATARAALAGDPAWRARVRLDWVTAEVALCCDDPGTALAAGRAAHRLSRDTAAPRHAAKSALVVAASLHASGRARTAARVLRAAAAGAGRLDLAPLESSVRTFRAEILQVRAPETARRERRRADTAQRIIDGPPESRSTR